MTVKIMAADALIPDDEADSSSDGMMDDDLGSGEEDASDVDSEGEASADEEGGDASEEDEGREASEEDGDGSGDEVGDEGEEKDTSEQEEGLYIIPGFLDMIRNFLIQSFSSLSDLET